MWQRKAASASLRCSFCHRYCCPMQKVGNDLYKMGYFYLQVGLDYHKRAIFWHIEMNYP